jgi:hypothetical protein
MGSALRRALGALRDAPVKTATQYCWHSCALRGSFIVEQWARQAPKGSFGLAPAGNAKETAASVSAPTKSEAMVVTFSAARLTCAGIAGFSHYSDEWPLCFFSLDRIIDGAASAARARRSRGRDLVGVYGARSRSARHWDI